MKQLLTSLTLIAIFAAILFHAAITPTPQRARVVTPDLIIRPITLDEALDASLRAGDGRRVDFGALGFYS